MAAKEVARVGKKYRVMTPGGGGNSHIKRTKGGEGVLVGNFEKNP